MTGFIEELTTPSNFRGDWYGYATNQISHTFLGCMIAALICAVTFALKGDLPYKINIFLGVAFIYGVKEIVWDRWQGFDTVEDFLFVVIYGTGGTLLTFTQSQDFTTRIDFEAFKFVAVLLLFFCHLLGGITIRRREAENGSA